MSLKFDVIVLFEKESSEGEGKFVQCDRSVLIQLYLSFPPCFTPVWVICAADILTQDITKKLSFLSQVHSWAPRKPFWEAVHCCSLGIESICFFCVFFLICEFNHLKSSLENKALRQINTEPLTKINKIIWVS